MDAREIEALLRALPDWGLAIAYLTAVSLALAAVIWVATKVVAAANWLAARRERHLIGRIVEVQRLYAEGAINEHDFRRRRLQLVQPLQRAQHRP